jgi:hypothetical protein
MELSLQQRLEQPFPPSAISWRIGRKTKDGKKAALLAYIDARDVMERLDDACGFGEWQCRYSLAVGDLLICEVGLRINGEWLWRANGAGDTQVEAEKGKCSDAFKRAAVVWGIGRYLYGLPSPYVAIDEYGKWDKDPTLPNWATPAGYLAKLQGLTVGAHPGDGVWEALDTATQIGLQNIATTVRDFIEAGDVAGAFDYVQKQALDNDEKAGLNLLLTESEIRSALKKEAERRKAA